jgi:hypothetical protein
VSPEPASYDPEEFVDGSQPWPLSQYVSYYHHDRTHLGLDKQTPAGRARSLEKGTVICQQRVGGLHHRYDWAA